MENYSVTIFSFLRGILAEILFDDRTPGQKIADSKAARTNKAGNSTPSPATARKPKRN